MTLRLSRGEYWVLTTVAEHCCPIDYLFADTDKVEMALNKTTHGLTTAELFDVLLTLHGQGKIYFYYPGDEQDQLENPQEILSAYLNGFSEVPLSYRLDRIHYGLTGDGGDTWEKFARPDWNKYVSSWVSGEDDNELAEIICTNEENLDLCIISISFHQVDIIKNTIQKDIVKPWEATYWKTLPKGYRARFKCKDKHKDFEEVMLPQELSFYKKLWCNWR